MELFSLTEMWSSINGKSRANNGVHFLAPVPCAFIIRDKPFRMPSGLTIMVQHKAASEVLEIRISSGCWCSPGFSNAKGLMWIHTVESWPWCDSSRGCLCQTSWSIVCRRTETYWHFQWMRRYTMAIISVGNVWKEWSKRQPTATNALGNTSGHSWCCYKYPAIFTKKHIYTHRSLHMAFSVQQGQWNHFLSIEWPLGTMSPTDLAHSGNKYRRSIAKTCVVLAGIF